MLFLDIKSVSINQEIRLINMEKKRGKKINFDSNSLKYIFSFVFVFYRSSLTDIKYLLGGVYIGCL